jgi:hypothetical protein
MLEQGVALRQELMRRLKEGATRPEEISDIYVALGRVSGVLSYAALDLGDFKAAMLHGETAWKMGDIARDSELRAWARGTQSLISRFDKNYGRARLFIVVRSARVRIVVRKCDYGYQDLGTRAARATVA